MKNYCDSLDERIIEYVYGEIENPAAEEELKKHLDTCDACREKVRQYKNVAARAKSIKVDFSEDVWKMQRESIIRKARKEKSKGVFPAIRDTLSGFFNVKKLSFALAILLLAAVGAGIQKHKQDKLLARDKAITEKFELYENLEIFERLDFYSQMSREGVL